MHAAMAQRPLKDLLGSEISDCICKKVHRIPTREADLQPGALERLPQMVRRHFPPGALLCVVDANTWAVAGQRAVKMLRDEGGVVHIHHADGRFQPAHADREAVADLVADIRRTDPSGLLAVGSGTINDISKAASSLTQLPLITVATAASMNGYPSAITALTDKGLKITEPCIPPLAIIADPTILATAPARMTGAGFGDLLSKNASTADWVLAHHLLGQYYCGLSAQVAEDAIRRCIAKADAIKANQPEGLVVLAEALLRSGISMVLAGSSSPASGGEHLISHLWDMTAHWSGRSAALHGEQTGVSTLISLRLYEKLTALDDGAVNRLCQEKTASEAPRDFEARMRELFRELAEAVLPYARTKFLDRQALLQRRRQIADQWMQIRAALAAIVIPAAQSRAYLQAAGAVWRIRDLGISTGEAAFAYRYARYIRNRYTVLDLSAELGMLEKWEAEVLEGI